MVTRRQREVESQRIIEPFVQDWLERADERFAAFRNWAVGQVLWDEGLSDEQIEESTIVDGPGDMGIDSWYLSEDGSTKVLYLVQAKDTKATKDDLYKLRNGFIDLFDPEKNVAANVEIRTRAAELMGEIDDDLSIEMHLVTSRLVAGSFLTSKLRDSGLPFDTNLIDVRGRKLKASLYVHDVESLASNLRLIKEDPIRATFEVGKGEYFEYRTGSKFLTVSAAVPAVDLAQLFNKNRLNLFRLNPRYYLSRKSKTNKDIEATLSGPDPDNFYLYNNGLTATASGVTVNDFNGVSLVHVDDFQIVNGCQTTVTIFESWRRSVGDSRLKDVRVPIRIIETPNAKYMAQKIAQTTNSQNQMKQEDFRSGDVLHQRLWDQFNRLSPKWFYEYKRGTWNTDYRTAIAKEPYTGGPYSPRRIQMKDLAQACLAFQGQPHKAFEGIASYFSAEDRYRQLFPEGCHALQLLFPYLLFLKADLVAKEYSEKYTWSTRYLRYPMVACSTKVMQHLLSEWNASPYLPVDLAEKLIDSCDEWASEILPVVLESMTKYVQGQASSGVGVRSIVRRRAWIDDVYRDVRYKIDIRLQAEAEAALLQGIEKNSLGLRRKFPVEILAD